MLERHFGPKKNKRAADNNYGGKDQIMKHIITLTAAISIAAISYAQNAPIAEKAFVVVRNGKEVTATYGGKPLTGNSWKDRKDPSAVLAAFFISYLNQTDDWHDLVVNNTFYEILVDNMNEAYAQFYGIPDTISITMSPEKCMFEGKGTAFYTIKIAYSYEGKTDEGEDEVTMEKDKERGEWLVAELPL